MREIFDRRWILDTNALSYIAGRDREALKEIGLIGELLFCPWPRITNPSTHEAALILQRLIVDQEVGMRPIDGDEDWSFFRFAVPEPNGGAFNVKRSKRLERFEVDSEQLLAAVPPTSTKQPPERHPGGAPLATDWPALKEALRREIAAVGFPSANAEPGWRTQADVIRWIEPQLGQDEPGKTALKENVRRMLEELRKEKAGN